jgi:bacillithiol system protein YtxJ
MARIEVVYFAQGNPDIPVYEVDVIHRGGLSRHIAEQLEIEHESPQVILLRRGQPLFDASHRGVSASALERELSQARAA